MTPVQFEIRTITSEEVFEKLCNLHPRYKTFWSDGGMEKHGPLIAKEHG